VELVESSTKEIEAKFIYENIIKRFVCPLTIINEQGTHFVNGKIKILLQNFMIGHKKKSTYIPKANGVVKLFNKNLCKGLTKIFGFDQDD
jgi:hypothetical protein